MKITRFKDTTGKYDRKEAIRLAVDILGEQGYVCQYDDSNIKHIRIDPTLFGFNIYSLTGRKTRCLTWEQYVAFNDTLNHIFNLFHWEANIRALHGQFVIRDLRGGKHERTWAPLGRENPIIAYRNTGAQPIDRKNYIESLSGTIRPVEESIDKYGVGA